MAEAISLARELNDVHGLAVALFMAAHLAHYQDNPAQVERLTSDLIELSTRQNFALWLAGGEIFRGWARSASSDTAQGISLIEHGIEDWRATGAMLYIPFWLALKAEALHIADRTLEALEAIEEALALTKRSEERWWSADCTGYAACFSRLWVLTRPRSRLRSAKPSAPQRSRSRFHWRNAPKQPTQNTVAKKREHCRGTGFACLFASSFGSMLRARNIPGVPVKTAFVFCR
jgi:predicted ATPase